MVLSGCVILPHGAMSFDGDPNSESEACRQRYCKLDPTLAPKLKRLHEGCCRAARLVADMDPEVIVLHSPHGVTLSESIGVYFNDAASGTTEWVGHWKEFKVDVTCATDLARGMVDYLKANNVSAEGVTFYSNLNVQTLRWGESIPTWYIIQALGEKAKQVKFVFMTSPRPRPAPLFSKTMEIGGVLYQYLEKQKQRIVFAVSGDLSHVYETSCVDPVYLPDPSANFRANNFIATGYEAATKSWALGQQESALETISWDPVIAETFLHKCHELQPKALSCGIGGFIFLHGIMNACVKAGGSIFSPTLTTCEAPTYYGLMAVTYSRINTT